MKYLMLMLLLVFISAAYSTDVDKLENRYIEMLGKYDNEYKEKCLKLSKSYIAELKKIQVAETKKGDLDEALKIKAKIQEVEKIIEDAEWKIENPEVPPSIDVEAPLRRFKGLYEVKFDKHTITYAVYDKEVKIISTEYDGKTYKRNIKVDFILEGEYVGLLHVNTTTGKLAENYNYIKPKSSIVIHTIKNDFNNVLTKGKVKKLRGKLP